MTSNTPPIVTDGSAPRATEATDEPCRRGRPSDISDPVRVTVSLTPEQLAWLDQLDADSRSHGVRGVIDQVRCERGPTKPQIDLDAANASLDGASAQDVIAWSARTFGQGLVMTSSFGTQSAVMLHLATQVVPDLPVIWIDTGFAFPETYMFAELLRKRLDLNLKVYQSPISPARMVAMDGQLWERGEAGLNKYDQIRKVEPQQRALAENNATALLTGVRSGQTKNRAGMRRVELLNGIYNVRPILDWTQKDVHDYLADNNLPYHPMRDQGYASIGDWHSTSPINAGEDERAGRFRGLKQECGLHLPQSAEEGASRDASSL